MTAPSYLYPRWEETAFAREGSSTEPELQNEILRQRGNGSAQN
jgi:hypothetical protein